MGAAPSPLLLSVDRSSSHARQPGSPQLFQLELGMLVSAAGAETHPFVGGGCDPSPQASSCFLWSQS